MRRRLVWLRRLLDCRIAASGALMLVAGVALAVSSSYHLSQRLLHFWDRGWPVERLTHSTAFVAWFMGFAAGIAGGLVLWAATGELRAWWRKRAARE